MRIKPEMLQGSEPEHNVRLNDAEAAGPTDAGAARLADAGTSRLIDEGAARLIDESAARLIDENAARQPVENVILPAVEEAASSPRDRRAKAAAFQLAAVVLTAAFAVLTFAVVTIPFIPADLAITRSLQSISGSFFSRLMTVVSWAGYSPQSGIAPFLIIVFFWLIGSRWEAASCLAAASAGVALNLLAKTLIHRARPTADLVHVSVALNSYGFPSGHVMFYTGFFGFVLFLIFTLFKPSWIRAFLLAVFGSHILLVGLSRIYLGAHWASDTVGAYLLGGICLIAAIRFYRWGKAHSFLRQPPEIITKDDVPNLVRTAGIHHPEALRHQDEDGIVREMSGCDQNMYKSSFQQQAGCGPCTATNLLDYAMQQCMPGVHALRMPDFIELMHQVWHYVKPGFMGVHRTRQLAEGIDRYAASRSLPFHSVRIDYPARRAARPSADEVIRFLTEGLDGDSPVAFLNLSNGHLAGLESWHWVTITAIFRTPDGDLQAEIANYGNLSRIDLGAWLRGTRLGGGFVYCRKSPASPG